MVNNAGEIRRFMTILEESTSISHQGIEIPLNEAFPVFTAQLKNRMLQMMSRFGGQWEGKSLVQKALVPYLKLFTVYMGRWNQTWNSVTWRTVLNFLVSKASLRLPLGELTPQQLTFPEIEAIIEDNQARVRISKYLGKAAREVNTLMPRQIRSVMTDPVSQDSNKSQLLITGLFVEAIRHMFEKAETAPAQGRTQAGAAGAGAAGAGTAGAAGAAPQGPPTPASGSSAAPPSPGPSLNPFVGIPDSIEKMDQATLNKILAGLKSAGIKL